MTKKAIIKAAGTFFVGIMLTSCKTASLRYDTAEANSISRASVSSEPMTEKARITESHESNTVSEVKVRRQIIYAATLSMVVKNISEAQEEIIKIANQLNGYLQIMDSEKIKIRVPSKNFKRAINQLSKTGQIIDKNIVSQDVTEKMLDLKIRLENAEKLCKRLQKLYDEGGDIKELLKLEKEIARVTEQIELMKGKIRYLQNMVSFSTILIKLNSPLPQEIIEQKIPIGWIRDLGDVITQNKNYYLNSSSSDVVDFELPKGYLKFQSGPYDTYGMSAANNMIKLTRHKNFEGGDLEFWADLIKMNLKTNKVFYVKTTEDLKIYKDRNAKLISTTKEIGNKKYGYNIAVAVNDDWVYTYENWGEEPDLNKEIPSIKISMKSMDIRPWWVAFGHFISPWH